MSLQNKEIGFGIEKNGKKAKYECSIIPATDVYMYAMYS